MEPYRFLLLTNSVGFVQEFYGYRSVEAAWVFSELLEPFAIAPQLLLFRRCADVTRLA